MVKKKTSRKHQPTMAFHGHADGGKHIVGIGNLRVVIMKDGDLWFAQGLEIDYAAQGTSVKDVKKQFGDGLYATLHEHLRVHGNIKGVLKIAPPEVWKETVYDAAANLKSYSLLSEHKFFEDEKMQIHLPFQNIDYLVENEGEAA